MGKYFSDRAADRIAVTVRDSEQRRRDTGGPPRLHLPVPHEICRFEMGAALSVPQNGPGVSWAHKLRWKNDSSHVGWDYGEFTSKWGYTVPAETWMGDYEVLENLERIVVVDFMRNHSKMATAGDDVGAYGLAWKPHDSIAQFTEAQATGDPSGHKRAEPFWEILWMQTPGDFVGHVQSALTTSTASVRARAFRQDGTTATTGHVTFGGYDVFGPEWIDDTDKGNGNVDIDVYNQPGAVTQYLFEADSGGVVYCKWNMRLSKYYIYQAECPEVTDAESYLAGEYYG